MDIPAEPDARQIAARERATGRELHAYVGLDRDSGTALQRGWLQQWRTTFLSERDSFWQYCACCRQRSSGRSAWAIAQSATKPARAALCAGSTRPYRSVQ